MKSNRQKLPLIPTEKIHPLHIVLEVTNLERDLIEIAALRHNTPGDVNRWVRDLVQASFKNEVECLRDELKGGKV